jgi:hypothetical protein
MKAFHSGREAKEFLVSYIVAEAQHENVALSEIERKMLYFTESGWTLPDMMKVSEDFDREYDQSKYERKIAKLIARADGRIRKSSLDDYERWWAAIRFLQREDHYISVMIRLAGLRPRGDQLKLFLAGLGVATGMLAWVFLSIKYSIPIPSRGDLASFVWAAITCLAVGYTIVRFVLGGNKTNDLTSKVLEKLVRVYQRVSGNR